MPFLNLQIICSCIHCKLLINIWIETGSEKALLTSKTACLITVQKCPTAALENIKHISSVIICLRIVQFRRVGG